MHINEKFNENRPVFSFEVFPPKKNSASVESIYQAISELQELKPDFISVTYGAGGNPSDTNTRDIAAYIKDNYHIDTMAHLTCVNADKGSIDSILSDLSSHGIDNILALRGDINPNIPPKKDFLHASDLITYIKNSHYDFGIAGACYPEVHSEAKDAIEDVHYLKHKVDSGAEVLVSQLFFDNNAFYAFRERAEIAGVNVPISAGIMPVTSKSQIERMVTMCGASMPAKFTHIMQRYGDNPQALTDAGIAYAIDQIIDLLAHGVQGIHLYTMNKPYVARKIKESIKNLL